MSLAFVPKMKKDRMTWGPQRIVCLTAESAEMLHRLGEGKRVVGISCYTDLPDARDQAVVSAFTTIRYDTIESLRPDLVIGFSDLQADAARELGKRGFQVLLTNQRTLHEMLATLVMLGRIVGRAGEAEQLAADLQRQIGEVRDIAARAPNRPRVYFEEWNDPLISGIGWVSELIEIAGGDDIFARLAACRSASDRIIAADEVIAQAPDIIVASWCGKRANLDEIRERPGWSSIPAIRANQLVEIDSAHCLQPGPSLILEGLPRFREIVERWLTDV